MQYRTVFLSAATVELQEHQDAVLSRVQKIAGWRCLQSTASNFWHEWHRHRTAVQTCDLFVGIIGNCYGLVLAHSGESITKTEYSWAVSSNRPRRIFMAPNDFQVPQNQAPVYPNGSYDGFEQHRPQQYYYDPSYSQYQQHTTNSSYPRQEVRKEPITHGYLGPDYNFYPNDQKRNRGDYQK